MTEEMVEGVKKALEPLKKKFDELPDPDFEKSGALEKEEESLSLKLEEIRGQLQMIENQRKAKSDVYDEIQQVIKSKGYPLREANDEYQNTVGK